MNDSMELRAKRLEHYAGQLAYWAAEMAKDANVPTARVNGVLREVEALRTLAANIRSGDRRQGAKR